MELARPQQRHLEAQGPRSLSPMEKKAVDLMFKGKISTRAIELEIVEGIDRDEVRVEYINVETRDAGEVVVSAYDGNGKIRISKSAFPHTQALDGDSAVDGSGWISPFKPGNMHYLSTLIHECTHYWQEKYGRHTDRQFNEPPVYRFNWEQLEYRDVPDLSPEQHASAVQIAFLIEWQLHLRKGSNVHLTSRSKDPAENVGPVDRFERIDFWFDNLKHKNILPKETSHEKRIWTIQQARDRIAGSFGWLLVELRYGWKAVCQGDYPY